MNDEVNKALDQAEARDGLMAQRTDIVCTTPEAARTFIGLQIDIWSKVVLVNGIKSDWRTQRPACAGRRVAQPALDRSRSSEGKPALPGSTALSSAARGTRKCSPSTVRTTLRRSVVTRRSRPS